VDEDIEIHFPIEFVVDGTPVSAQAVRRQSVHEWKARLVEASKGSLPAPHFASEGPISVTLFFFPASELAADIDNLVKPILDAFKQHIYVDDFQVERLLVQKFEPDRMFEFRTPSATLEDAISRPKPTLYVRLSDDPFEELAG
jgi:Holliday junction resolvase RusA-like endonuclease